MLFWPKSSGCCCGGCGTIAVTVRDCDSNETLAGASVVVKDPDGATIGSGTTDVSGVYSVGIDAAGDYAVEVSNPGQPTVYLTLAATCDVNNVTIRTGMIVKYPVTGCNGPLSGLTVYLTHVASGRTYTGTTDTSNVANAVIAVGEFGTFAYSIAADRYATKTGTTNHSACVVQYPTLTLVPATGYACITLTCFQPPPGMDSTQCSYPVATTLHLTDSVWGAVTLTYDSRPPLQGGGADIPGWWGTKTVDVPPCDGVGDPRSAVVDYHLRIQTNVSGVVMFVRFVYQDDGSGAIIAVGCTANEFCPPAQAVELDLSPLDGQESVAGLYCDAMPTFVITE